MRNEQDRSFPGDRFEIKRVSFLCKCQLSLTNERKKMCANPISDSGCKSHWFVFEIDLSVPKPMSNQTAWRDLFSALNTFDLF